jgi:hypothetical protein
MSREGATSFRELVGKLAVLTRECDKWGRCYRGDRLIARDWMTGAAKRPFSSDLIGAIQFHLRPLLAPFTPASWVAVRERGRR